MLLPSHFTAGAVRRTTRLASAAGLLALGFAATAAEPSGSVALTSDYVWRGTTQSDGEPAIQGGLKVAADSGLYASVWGSSVEFAPGTGASSEFDLAVGWSGALGPDWTLDANLLHYRYPGTDADLDWTELNGSLTWRGTYWLALGWSPEALGSDEAGTYVQAGARWPIGERVRLELAAGHYALDDVYGRSYSHAQLGVAWAVAQPLELRLTVHATDDDASAIFGRDYAGDRVEAAVHASF